MTSNGERFWEGFSLTLAKKYDLSQVGRVVVGSDGAKWARLINLREQGQLHLWVTHRAKKHRPHRSRSPAFTPRANDTECGAWLEAGLPAVCGPQANRPWVQALKAITSQPDEPFKRGTRIQPTKP